MEQMDAAGAGRRKPSAWWILITAIAGAVGALAAVSAFSASTYDVRPFTVELSARPGRGVTELTVRPAVQQKVPGFPQGVSEASTHASPMTFRMTVLDVDPAQVPATARAGAAPLDMANHIRFSEEGKEAFASFGMRLGMLALAGGLAGGVAVSLGRWQRMLGGVLAGALTIALIGLLLHQTYDVTKFGRSATFRTEQAASASP